MKPSNQIVPPDHQALPEAMLAPTQHDGRLNRALTRVSGAPLRRGNAIDLLCNGPTTYEDWLAAIGRAQHWVHLENYIFKDDGIGKRFAEALIERAAAGVAVRVLYDWFGSLDVSPRFWSRLRQAGVDVRAVNAVFKGAPLDIVQRDHRKLLAVDGIYASVGGVCIADPWLSKSPESGLPYRDTAVRVSGPVVADLERAFATVWDSVGSPLPDQELPDVGGIAPAGAVAARVVAEEPGRMRMLRVLQLALAAAERRVWIADAYFLGAQSLREALITAAGDGVDVRILLPATNDLPLVGALSRYGYRPLLQAGVRIWEYTGLMMHAKTTVADGWWARIGSTNLNVTGLLTNWELDLVAEDRQFSALMEAMYEDDLAHSREIRLGGSSRRMRPRPDRPESRAERYDRTHRPFVRSLLWAAIARVRAAFGAATTDTLQQHERTVGAAIGATLLSLSVLSARFPRLLAWPLAAIGGLFGAVSLVRAAGPIEPAERPHRRDGRFARSRAALRNPRRRLRGIRRRAT